MRTELVKIIENLLAGDRTKELAYAELLVKNCERKYDQTKDIFDKYEAMGARNIVHMMKGEPKEGGTAVLDDFQGSTAEQKPPAETKTEETVQDILKRMDDRANHLHLTAFNNATEDSLRVTLHNFLLEVDDYKLDIEKALNREKATVLQAATEVARTPTEIRYEANPSNPKRNCDRFSSSEELKEYLRTHSVNRNGKIFIDGKPYTTAYVWLFEPWEESDHA